MDYLSWVCACGHVNPIARDSCASCKKDRIDAEIEAIRADGKSERSLRDDVMERLRRVR